MTVVKVRQVATVVDAPAGSNLSPGDEIDIETTFEGGRAKIRTLGKHISAENVYVEQAPRAWAALAAVADDVPATDGWRIDVPALRIALAALRSHLPIISASMVDAGRMDVIQAITDVEYGIARIVEDDWRPRGEPSTPGGRL